MQKTAIIVPCYNEANRLKSEEFIGYSKKNKWVHFIFVNDGSNDGTLKIIDYMCLTNPDQMLYVTLKMNAGKAEAVRQGTLSVIDSDFSNIGYWDADLSTPLEVIDKLCSLLADKKYIAAFGSRVRLLGHNIERKALRHYLGRIFATCASWVLKLPIYDTQCGAKIFKNNSKLKKVFSTPFAAKWIFDVEILARYGVILQKKGLGSLESFAVEYPLRKWTHIGESKVKALDFIIAIKELYRIYMTYKFDYRR
jgi:glycosyltransferase involved in cell wall biosynthesis